MCQVQRLKITDIDKAPELRFRKKLDSKKVQSFKDKLRDANFPPITVVRHQNRYILADGHHRLEAHLRAGAMEIDAVVVPGSEKAVKFLSIHRNRGGLGNDEKRKAIRWLLQWPQIALQSSRRIAEFVGCTHNTVEKVRRGLQDNEKIPVQPVRCAVRGGCRYNIRVPKRQRQ